MAVKLDCIDGFASCRCGLRLPCKSTVYHNCKAASRGLGDVVADGLSAIGITKELAQKAAKAVGLKDCGCDGRQKALNDLSNWVLGRDGESKR